MKTAVLALTCLVVFIFAVDKAHAEELPLRPTQSEWVFIQERCAGGWVGEMKAQAEASRVDFLRGLKAEGGGKAESLGGIFAIFREKLPIEFYNKYVDCLERMAKFYRGPTA